MFDWLLGKGGSAYAAPDERSAWQARNAYYDQQARGKGLEDALAQQYQQAMSGDTAAQAQLRLATDQNVAMQQSAAASARGGAMQQALARQGAMNNAVSAQQQAGAQSAILRQKEVQDALAAQTGYQLGREQSAAGMLGNESSFYGAKNQMAQARGTADNDRSQAGGKMIGQGLAAAGSLMMLSDERAKVDAGPPSQDQLVELLRSQEPHVYRYDGQPAGTERLGVMAQDLEQSDLGRALVSEGADGLKRIDTEAALSALLAEMGAINARIDELGSKSATVRKGGA